MNLEHQGIKTENRGEGTIGDAGNNARCWYFLAAPLK
jgi:hypothetical protein